MKLTKKVIITKGHTWSLFMCLVMLPILVISLGSCTHKGNESGAQNESPEDEAQSYVQRVDTLGLIVLYPQYESIDLVCGTVPSKKDTRVILFAEAAYTGELLKEFKHSNVAGDHVSDGKLHKGFRCKRNTGAFVYYNGTFKFCHKDYAKEMEVAAQNGGSAFAQELMIHKGRLVEIARKDTNTNQFRALCNQNGKLCIVESASKIAFGDFKKKMMELDISDALYLDMGNGWNYAWYRDAGKIVELHPKTHNYCTNWITFYK
jgi:hypothetical protein